MRKIVYGMNVSLDGFVTDAEGSLDWGLIDEEFHRFANQREAEIGLHLYGRRLYETMRYWETADTNPASTPVEIEYARIWQRTPSLVFSRTLDSVGEGARLAREVDADEIARLKAEPGLDLNVGGPDLAATFMRLDLIDEVQVYVHPVILGSGKPMFPELTNPIQLRLIETHTFSSGVVWMRYERVGKQEDSHD